MSVIAYYVTTAVIQPGLGRFPDLGDAIARLRIRAQLLNGIIIQIEAQAAEVFRHGEIGIDRR